MNNLKSSGVDNIGVPRIASHEAGLTLVEMLVVLAIVGVMAGALVLSIGSGNERTAEVEARRLATRLELAADEATVTGRAIGFAWKNDGYRFVTWKSGGWRNEMTPALEPHDLPAGVSLASASGDRQPVVIGADGGGQALALRIAAVKGAGWTIAFDGAQAQAKAGE
jgi:general secretion pathway protein H